MKQNFLLEMMTIFAFAAAVICCIVTIKFSPEQKHPLYVAKIEQTNFQNMQEHEKYERNIYHNMKDNVITENTKKKSEEKMQKVSHFPMNINDADKEALMQVKGIGEKRAEDILQYRSQRGKIQAMEELLKIKGIGEKTLENLCRKFYA